MSRFQPGQSGNPSGRPARAVEEARLSVLARIFDEAAEERVILAQIMLACDPDRKGSNAAAKWLFDRKYGPVRQVEEADRETVIRVVYEEDGQA